MRPLILVLLLHSIQTFACPPEWWDKFQRLFPIRVPTRSTPPRINPEAHFIDSKPVITRNGFVTLEINNEDRSVIRADTGKGTANLGPLGDIKVTNLKRMFPGLAVRPSPDAQEAGAIVWPDFYRLEITYPPGTDAAQRQRILLKIFQALQQPLD